MISLNQIDLNRMVSLEGDEMDCSYRDDIRRDYGRVLHSPSFRRLEGKTQLFPGYESDFFRNRLTHSLEVAQIAKTIATKLKSEPNGSMISPDICEIAGLLHDIGHPPFGHNGERALNKCMKNAGGFEGNAQTLHIVGRTEKKEQLSTNPFEKGSDSRCGLNLTFRTIASILKYDREIPKKQKDESVIKGYYATDAPIVHDFKKALVGNPIISNFKTIECSIMDIADDIAYSTYDLEDAFKAGFITPFSMMGAKDAIFEKIAKKLNPHMNPINLEEEAEACRWDLIEIFDFIWKDYSDTQKRDKDISEWDFKIGEILAIYDYSEQIASNGFIRTRFTSKLVKYFINGITLDFNAQYPILSGIKIEDQISRQINILKHFAYEYLVNSPRLKIVENRGFEIIEKLFSKLDGENGVKYLPEDYQELYLAAPSKLYKKRIICDFIAGMTDQYATEFYGRLFSSSPQTIFKPI